MGRLLVGSSTQLRVELSVGPPTPCVGMYLDGSCPLEVMGGLRLTDSLPALLLVTALCSHRPAPLFGDAGLFYQREHPHVSVGRPRSSQLPASLHWFVIAGVVRWHASRRTCSISLSSAFPSSRCVSLVTVARRLLVQRGGSVLGGNPYGCPAGKDGHCPAVWICVEAETLRHPMDWKPLHMDFAS